MKSVITLKTAFEKWVSITSTRQRVPGMVGSHAPAIGVHAKIPAYGSPMSLWLKSECRLKELTRVVPVTNKMVMMPSPYRIQWYGLGGKNRR